MGVIAARRVLIIDDHPIVRDGIEQLLARQPDLRACGGTGDGESALRIIQEQAPDIAVVDLSLGHESGLDLMPVLVERAPDMGILAFSMHDEALYARRALQAGARGYIMKHESADLLLLAIRTVLAGQVYVSPRVSATLLRVFADGGSTRRLVGSGSLSELSNRELQVYRLMGHGLSTKEIASQLHLSAKTVESHRAHIKHKLGLESTTALVAHAAEWIFRAGHLTDASSPPQPRR